MKTIFIGNSVYKIEIKITMPINFKI